MILYFKLIDPHPSTTDLNKLHLEYNKCLAIGSASEVKKYGSKITNKGKYIYNWHDEWRTTILVVEVTKVQAQSLRKKSNGFCGCEWMIKSIIKHLDILEKERPCEKNSSL